MAVVFEASPPFNSSIDLGQRFPKPVLARNIFRRPAPDRVPCMRHLQIVQTDCKYQTTLVAPSLIDTHNRK
jgi:hypothetical protein